LQNVVNEIKTGSKVELSVDSYDNIHFGVQYQSILMKHSNAMRFFFASKLLFLMRSSYDLLAHAINLNFCKSIVAYDKGNRMTSMEPTLGEPTLGEPTLGDLT
jgi:hypothetical protein